MRADRFTSSPICVDLDDETAKGLVSDAELIHMRAELVESKSKREILEQELHNLLLQLHTAQLSQLPTLNGNFKQDAGFKPDVNNIKKKLEDELKRSPSHSVKNEELKFSPTLLEVTQLKNEKTQLQIENAALRNSILALNSEVYGAKLAAKYLDKELAGRIQQLQLLGREMRGDVRDKLWRQLESEILLQRHKTVVRECRRNSVMNNHADKTPAKPDGPGLNENGENFGDIRTVVVKRKSGQGLGISITGGREHGVPILISELEPNGPAAVSGQLYIGDAILSVNDRDLRQACHREAVDILKQPSEECRLQVQYIAADDSDNSLEEDGYNFRFFDTEVCNPNDSITLHSLNPIGVVKTPTAPRTPDSTSQSGTTSRPMLGYNTPPNNTELYNDSFIIDKVIETLQTTDISNQNILPTTQTNTTDLICMDNSTLPEINRNETIPPIEDQNFKKLPPITDENLNCSSNSLNSENLSSPMQTSTDMFLDSEILSTDVASNDSQSPKNLDKGGKQLKDANSLMEMKQFNEFCLNYKKSSLYGSIETFSNTKSDQSLLNSDSCDSSPIHKTNRDYKKIQRRHKTKKYFGVKTLQSIFSKHGGYSDVSSTASDFGDEFLLNQKPESIDDEPNTQNNNNPETESSSNFHYNLSDTTPQFEENIHHILSEMFRRNFDAQKIDGNLSSKNLPIRRSLRVGKALRLCPNEEVKFSAVSESDLKREKLLARYVYNANCLNAEGVGDPDFGTPV
ncbi:golgi-associated pdz and coiled-coil motif-containing [Holotrichia oblita]|uniref:Golgi-associated pdz and coiled-coil motif-containing n=1 Tax=Holotrichia oblita TaxID=644536 RepID=A0ACB9THU3_HOLOL|nr:golgi-associated pdz and coiled-coil motif-containing [Holotrichia oblita]